MLNNTVKQKLITKYLKTPAGRQKLAAGMTKSLRARRDYLSAARKAFYVEELPDGALPVYDTDPEIGAYYAGENGDAIVTRKAVKRVNFDLFEIYANPEERLVELKNRRFDLVDRMKAKGTAEVLRKEDLLAFKLMADAATSNAASEALTELSGTLTASWIGTIFAVLEQEDLPVDRLFMNGFDYAGVRGFGRDYFDPETQQVLIKTGVMGDLWGAKVIKARTVAKGNLFAATDPELLGRIAERISLTVMPDDDVHNRRVGFSIFEYIAMGIHNPLGIAHGKRSGYTTQALNLGDADPTYLNVVSAG
jgi:hypothetical protein